MYTDPCAVKFHQKRRLYAKNDCAHLIINDEVERI